MNKVLLDTSFIITCIRQRVDFIEELSMGGFRIVIPKQVIEELKGLSGVNDGARIALQLLEKTEFDRVTLRGKIVDQGIVNYAKENKDLIVATLDNEIKGKIPNRKIIIRGKNRLEVV